MVRFATFNTSLNRDTNTKLINDLKASDNIQARKIAEIIQRVRPDVLLLNEFDYEERHEAIALFQTNYLSLSQNRRKPIEYEFHFLAAVNTGVDSKLDLNQNGETGEPSDAFGFGEFPGQFGMVVLSRFPIEPDGVRTFRMFRWKDMPSAKLPNKPNSDQPYHSKKILRIFRLSSKSLWDIPVTIENQTVHFLVSHPTPSVFDGPEDRNGCRNHDEIRMLADYVDPDLSAYVYDDRKKRGGLKKDAHFVIAGDMNADPFDGDSKDNAILQLLNHSRINSSFTPTSRGAFEQAKRDGKINTDHRGNHAADTSDFNDFSVGNLRLDYVLPSNTLTVAAGGVFWPAAGDEGHELISASDHRLVWIDLNFSNSR